MALLLPYLDEHVDDARALFILGFIFLRSEKPGLALQVCKRSTDLAPHEPVTWHNLGKAYYDVQRPEDAERCWRTALKLNPGYVNALDGLGLINLQRSDYGQAIEYCKRALAIDPTVVDSKVNMGMSMLALHKWEGWRGYNENLGTNKDRKVLDYSETPRWDGAKDKEVVVFGEQGIGDEISFASCLPDLIRDSKSVTIETDKRLEGLFRRSFGVEVHGTRYKDERPIASKCFDGKVAVAELPMYYRNRDEDFPGTPYLIADPQMRVQWRALFDSLGPEPKVGIAWTGGRKQTGTNRRSVNLDTLLPVLKNKAHFISLQYHDPSDEIEAFEERHGIKIHHWPHGVQSYDYDPTMALIAELDLVISVTTTVVHAAGALGKECWCLVPEKVMWRYGVKGSDFPWAKSVTLFRQRGREWPMHILAAKLKELCDSTTGRA